MLSLVTFSLVFHFIYPSYNFSWAYEKIFFLKHIMKYTVYDKAFFSLFHKVNILQAIMEACEWRTKWGVDRQVYLLHSFGKTNKTQLNPTKSNQTKPNKNTHEKTQTTILNTLYIIPPYTNVVIIVWICRNFGTIALKSEYPEFSW